MDFYNFSGTTSQENAKVTGVSCHTFVMLLPYRVKVSDTKVTHFTPILALCTFISITFTETSIDETNKTQQKVRLKIYVHNVHHSRKHMHSNDYAIAAVMMVWSSSLHLLSRRSFNSFTS